MRKSWSDEEIALLKSSYHSMTNIQLEEAFPGRTLISIYKKAYKLGFRKDEKIEFENRSNARKREKSSTWKGGRKKTKAGYTMILMPEHHRAERSGYVMEHIVIFERETGIEIPDGCCVHHINGNKSDNRISNLCMMTHGAHTVLHSTGRKHTEETKAKIRCKTKERFSNKQDHPSYKDIDVKAMIADVKNGKNVSDVCKSYGICKSTYYEKKRGFENGIEQSSFTGQIDTRCGEPDSR